MELKFMNTAKIISISKPLIDGIETAEDFIAYTARVSNPSNQMNLETSEKLLKYLIRNKHWSPFEMVSVTMQIDTTRDIARQILRHRSFSFQEFSQRYADPTKDLGFVFREARNQDTKNRQNSIETDDKQLRDNWQAMQNVVRIATLDAYKWAINNGIAKEQARAVLPEGLTVSRLYMSGTLRSWIHYIQLRTDEYIDPRTGELIKGTQKEHREVAESAKQELLNHFSFLNAVFE
jgi:thymidylate synthase (FAD)